MPNINQQIPYKLYTPAIREPLPLRRKPFLLPAPPESPDKPQKINWLQTLLPPFIMLVVLSIVASVMQTRGFIIYTIALMGIYPIARVIAYVVQKNIYEKEEIKRAAVYALELEHAEREIATHIRKQREFLKHEFLPTEDICKLAEEQGDTRSLWYRTKNAVDFLALRTGVYDGKPSFSIEVPKGDDVEAKDPLLGKARDLKKKYQILDHIPYLLKLKELGSVAILGEEKLRYGLARRLLLDVLVHHRPDEVDVYVLSNHAKAADLWKWLRWAPHSKVFDERKQFNALDKSFDEYKDLDHLIFGSQAVKIFLGRLENDLQKNIRPAHQLFVIDVDGIQQYDDDFIDTLISKTLEGNISLLFVGGNHVPRSVRGILKFKDNRTSLFVDTRIDIKDKDEKEYHTLIDMDELPRVETCERISRSLAGIKLLSSSGDVLLSPNVNLFNVLGLGKDDKLTFNEVAKEVVENWGSSGQTTRSFDNKELLQFPIGLVEKRSRLVPFSLNLLEARFKGMDAYHTMLIGTTGSGKSEFIKSLILGAAYKYPPQYLNFFCMDFKGGSTVEDLKVLPHVIGVMTNLDEVLAQRGLIAIGHEIDRRQTEFNIERVKDIWEFNEKKSINERMPHLILVLDEFTRGLEMLNTPEFNLQELLEKRLVPQGRSLGIYLLLANQVVNAKVTKLLPNTGWRVALRVASADQLQFIDSGLKPPKFRGRGYVQAIGEDPVEFQSGYSGDYVKYADTQIKPMNIPIKELLPNGNTRDLKYVYETEAEKDTFSEYKEGNQLIKSILFAQDKLQIESAKKIYLPPLSRLINLNELDFDKYRYRAFSDMRWRKSKEKNKLLQVPIGKVDLVYRCEQRPLYMDFLKNNSDLLIVGSQTDIVACLRSILFTLLLSHSPDDVQVYLLEFGKGLHDLPQYPHIGDIVDEQESERIARTINFFEAEFSRREKLSRSGNNSLENSLPHLFLVINNIAGLIEYINLYKKVFRFISQESYKYGVHLTLTALPRGTGTRVPSSDLKNLKSRIVFPSIIHDDYWSYLEASERKLVKLTEAEKPHSNRDVKTISRAHWLCLNDTLFEEPVELQIVMPRYHEQSDEELVALMNKAGEYSLPEKIRILEKKYILKKSEANNSNKRDMLVGVQSLDLKELKIPFGSLPSVWGVSGPRESGKTNFLTLLVEQWSSVDSGYAIEVFAMFPNQLTDYCKSKKQSAGIGREQILEKLKKIEAGGFENKAKKTLLVFDDINFIWEPEPDANKETKALLEKLTNKMYDHKDMMLVASFNYSLPFKTAKSRDALVRDIHDNKTGLCLGYEGEWIISSVDLLSYKKNLSTVVPPGRGVFVLKGTEIEIQAFWHEGG